MNNIDEMPPICHDCPYWEVCEKPYICSVTESCRYNVDEKVEEFSKLLNNSLINEAISND